MLGKHGSFRRYLLTAGFNTLVFLILFIFFRELMFPGEGYWASVSWAFAWIIGSLIAHWTHRIWTFKSERDPKWTVPASMTIYTIGWVGSTATYYIGSEVMGLNEYMVWVLNSSLWGVLNYLGQREIAFKELSEE